MKEDGAFDRLRQTVRDAMSPHNSRDEFRRLLKAEGIDAVFRINPVGRIYGVTFIEHNAGIIANGSVLDLADTWAYEEQQRLIKEYLRSFFDFGIFEERPLQDFAVQGHFSDITFFGAVLGGFNHDIFTVFQMDHRLSEQRRTYGVFVRRGAYGIEPQGREYIPC